MTVLSVSENRNSPTESRGRDGKKVKRRAVRVFEVITDTIADDANAVLSSADVPDMGDRYYYRGRTDDRMVVINLAPSRSEKVPTIWTVRATYERVTPDEASEDEYLSDVDIEWGAEDRVFVPVKSSSGADILTSAGDKFNPPPTDTEPITTVSLSRNESDRFHDGTFVEGPFFSTTIRTYQNKTNSTTFLGYPDGSVLCTAVKSSRREMTAKDAGDEIIRYWRVTYNFKIRHDPSSDYWKAVLLDYGPNYLDFSTDANGQKVRITDTIYESNDAGGHVMEGKLDGFGNPLGTTLTSSTLIEVFREFTLKGTVDFNDLDFNEAFLGVK